MNEWNVVFSMTKELWLKFYSNQTLEFFLYYVCVCSVHDPLIKYIHSQCLSILIFKANTAHLIIQTIVDDQHDFISNSRYIFILQKPHLVYNVRHSFLIIFGIHTVNEDWEWGQTKIKRERERAKKWTTSLKCLFNAYTHKSEIDIDGYAKEIPSTGNVRISE